MSRYYDIQILNPTTGALLKRYTSFTNGKSDPGALKVEMDVMVAAVDEPFGTSYVRVWGIGLKDISQASNLNNANISVSAGMQKGLPLANPQQAGPIVTGSVAQAFGNWQDTNMTLDLQIRVGSYNPSPNPPNLVFNWLKGQPLSTAILDTLQTAYPGSKVSISISPKLTNTETQVGFYGSPLTTSTPAANGALVQFGIALRRLTMPILGGSYPGVSIKRDGSTFSVYDGTVMPSTKALAFQDLIGQVSWNGPGTINFKTVMRSDISVGDVVKLPQGEVVLTTVQSYSQYSTIPTFQGLFQIKTVRHVGNSRGPSGNDWVTVFDAYGPVSAPSGSAH